MYWPGTDDRPGHELLVGAPDQVLRRAGGGHLAYYTYAGVSVAGALLFATVRWYRQLKFVLPVFPAVILRRRHPTATTWGDGVLWRALVVAAATGGHECVAEIPGR